MKMNLILTDLSRTVPHGLGSHTSGYKLSSEDDTTDMVEMCDEYLILKTMSTCSGLRFNICPRSSLFSSLLRALPLKTMMVPSKDAENL